MIPANRHESGGCVELSIVMLTGGCGAAAEGVDTPGGTIVTERIDLPPPAKAGGGSLVDALARRRSVREYVRTPLDMAEISLLLWAAQGVTSSAGQRSAPSAGALYPLEVYLATGRGRYHYDPYRHRLEVLGKEDLRRELSRAARSQQAVEEAAALFVFAAVYSRTMRKYGDRAERYVKFEAGHAAQNLLLQAVSLGLGAVPIGAFDDDQVQAILGLPSDHEPLYLVPVGHPAK
ncbi:NADPH-flavin oxidoreductase [bacterium BMS3Bbin01]|nr:NADPH-flavin oxidoreductase [bacterium BMS3Bbin01]